MQLVDQGEDGLPGGLAEIPGRFIGRHDRGLANEGTGDRDPLTLTTGELGRTSMGRSARPTSSRASSAHWRR
jgi:hypothetical protein